MDDSPPPPGVPAPDPALNRALDEAIARFAAAARRLTWRAGLSADDLDDLLQEARMRLWRSLGSAEKIRDARPFYLQRTILSAAVDLIRRRRARREESLEEEAGHAEVAATDGGVEATLAAAEMEAAVARALDTLVIPRRTAVRLHLAGYTRDEIARMLGWSEPKTRNLLYRGLDDLRQALTRAGIHAGGGR